MTSVQAGGEASKSAAILTDSGDESDDAYDDVIEVSPCGRWEKRRMEVRLTSIVRKRVELMLIYRL